MAVTSAESIGLRYQGIPSVTTAVVVATVPASRSYSAIKVSIANNSTTTGITYEVFLVPSGQSATTTYRVLPPYLVPANLMSEYVCPHELPAGYTVQVKVSLADTVTVMCSARELS